MSKSVKIATVLLVLLGVFRIVASVQMIITGEKDLDSSILFILNAIAIIGIALGAFQRGEKWAWWTLLIIVMIPPIYCIIAHGWLTWNIMGLIISTLPMVIPARIFIFR
jgi:hypothetical protein